MKNIYKLAILGSLFSLTNCYTDKQLSDEPVKITNSYIMQTCDREGKAYFIEMKQGNENFAAFINTQNAHKIPSMKKQYPIGKQISGALVKASFDGIYQIRE